jgi:hypothetical protein
LSASIEFAGSGHRQWTSCASSSLPRLCTLARSLHAARLGELGSRNHLRLGDVHMRLAWAPAAVVDQMLHHAPHHCTYCGLVLHQFPVPRLDCRLTQWPSPILAHGTHCNKLFPGGSQPDGGTLRLCCCHCCCLHLKLKKNKTTTHFSSGNATESSSWTPTTLVTVQAHLPRKKRLWAEATSSSLCCAVLCCEPCRSLTMLADTDCTARESRGPSQA